jgi:hypothetical protein
MHISSESSFRFAAILTTENSAFKPPHTEEPFSSRGDTMNIGVAAFQKMEHVTL